MLTVLRCLLAHSEKREARSEKREARSEKREARSEKRERFLRVGVCASTLFVFWDSVHFTSLRTSSI
ncbi:hypothetical protein BSZ04_24285 [Vibrio rotiferianus]|nr:hypothetical protein BSZ04_24285 [Vibrio rotiferianus]